MEYHENKLISNKIQKIVEEQQNMMMDASAQKQLLKSFFSQATKLQSLIDRSRIC